MEEINESKRVPTALNHDIPIKKGCDARGISPQEQLTKSIKTTKKNQTPISRSRLLLHPNVFLPSFSLLLLQVTSRKRQPPEIAVPNYLPRQRRNSKFKKLSERESERAKKKKKKYPYSPTTLASSPRLGITDANRAQKTATHGSQGAPSLLAGSSFPPQTTSTPPDPLRRRVPGQPVEAEISKQHDSEGGEINTFAGSPSTVTRPSGAARRSIPPRRRPPETAAGGAREDGNPPSAGIRVG